MMNMGNMMNLPSDLNEQYMVKFYICEISIQFNNFH